MVSESFPQYRPGKLSSVVANYASIICYCTVRLKVTVRVSPADVAVNTTGYVPFGVTGAGASK